jgi:hypothetical protein
MIAAGKENPITEERRFVVEVRTRTFADKAFLMVRWNVLAVEARRHFQ